jgi:hypothetical protein
MDFGLELITCAALYIDSASDSLVMGHVLLNIRVGTASLILRHVTAVGLCSMARYRLLDEKMLAEKPVLGKHGLCALTGFMSARPQKYHVVKIVKGS